MDDIVIKFSNLVFHCYLVLYVFEDDDILHCIQFGEQPIIIKSDVLCREYIIEEKNWVNDMWVEGGLF